MRESEINPANKQDGLIQVTLHLLHVNLDACGRCWHEWRRGLNPSLTASSAISISTGFFAPGPVGQFQALCPRPCWHGPGNTGGREQDGYKSLLPPGTRQDPVGKTLQEPADCPRPAPGWNPAGPRGKDTTGTCGLPSPSPSSPWARPRPHHALPSQLPAPPWQNFWRPQHYFQHSRPCILLTRELDKGSGNLPPFLDPSALLSEAVTLRSSLDSSLFMGSHPKA